MRYAIIPAIAAAFLTSASLAYAAAGYYPQTGEVASIDMSAMTLRLNGGEVFHLPQGWTKPADLSEGDKVKVTYDIRDREKVLADVTILENH